MTEIASIKQNGMMKEDEDVLLFFHFCVNTSMGMYFSFFLFCNFWQF